MELSWLKALDDKNKIRVGETVTSTKEAAVSNADVIYPAFLACIPLVEEQELKNLFLDLAKGVKPKWSGGKSRSKGFSVRNKSLAYTNGNKTIAIQMSMEPEALKDSIINLFTTHCGMMKTTKETKVEIASSPVNWEDVKKKISRHNYILDYVCQMGEKNGWTWSTTEAACQQMTSWIQSGDVKVPSVVMEKGKITSIPSVTFSTAGMELIPSNSSRTTPSGEDVVHISRLYCRDVVAHKTQQCEAEDGGETSTVG